MTPPTLVFLHHFGGSARSWDTVLARLGGALPTLVLDLPGFGDAAGAPGPYTVSAYADFVVAELRARGLGEHILVGHSMGGKIALAMATRRPAGLRALVLLAPSPPTPEPIEDEWRAAMIAGWAQYSTASRMLALATAIPLREDARKVVLDDAMRAGKAAWTSWLAHGSREDWSRELAKVAVPVTILSGTRDTVLPTELVRREIVNRLAMFDLHTVPAAGHLLPFEAPDAVADAIGRAASDLSRKGRSADRAVGHPRSLHPAELLQFARTYDPAHALSRVQIGPNPPAFHQDIRSGIRPRWRSEVVPT